MSFPIKPGKNWGMAVSVIFGLLAGLLALIFDPVPEGRSSKIPELPPPVVQVVSGELEQPDPPEPEIPVVPALPTVPDEPPRTLEHPVQKPWLALVIDDFGNSIQIAREISQLPLKATWAVLPDIAHTESTISLARQNRQPYIVHLPMQAESDSDGHKGYLIGRDTPPEKIRAEVQRLYRSYPDAAGVNNHRGSRATASKKTMEVFMKAMAKTPWGFLDSRTTGKSVAFALAMKYHIPVVKNAVFIDGVMELPKMKSQFALALKRAEKHGSAVAICHARTGTLPFLRWLAQNGAGRVHMVTLDEVWSRTSR